MDPGDNRIKGNLNRIHAAQCSGRYQLLHSSCHGCTVCCAFIQNALKVFADFPAELLDIVKSTDPSTVTQHGLYIRALGDAPEGNVSKLSPTQDSQQPPSQTPTQTQPQPASPKLEQSHQNLEQGNKQQQCTEETPQEQASLQQSSSGQGQNAGQVSEGPWGRGRVTLLGDAAHATIPNGASLQALSCQCHCCVMW